MMSTLLTMDELMTRLPRPIRQIFSAELKVTEPFINMVARFADEPGTIALLSGGGLDSARYHILGLRPWLSVRECGGKIVMDCTGKSASAEGDPFEILEALVKRYTLPGEEKIPPLSAGLLGYLSYDLKDCLEILPRTSHDDLGLPRLYMNAPSILIVHDRHENKTNIHLPVHVGDEIDARSRLVLFEKELASTKPPIRAQNAQVGPLQSGLSREEYITAVEAVRDYIVRGHVYQVNMSQRFETEFSGDAFALFANLFEANPAPFFAFVQAGDHQIISTSPERFIELRGRAVETRPIKGTRPRGTTPEQDQTMRQDLETSLKDDAELSMIVDLLRNDIGKVCAAGTVHVTEHKRVEAYENVYHLVSLIRGDLDFDRNAVDLIRATFPGGSITGCPKIRSMEIIDELEPVRRHIYTGSIGYLGFHGTMDLSIAIRTATIVNGRLVFSVGGGVVFDSNAGLEFEETLHKGRTLMRALEQGRPSDTTPNKSLSEPPRFGWCNGKLKPMSEMTVSVESEGFAYGYGFFETIRVERGRALMLDAHIARFRHSWSMFFDSAFPDYTWHDVISLVVAKNALNDKIAAVKLTAAAGKTGQSKQGPNLIVTARPYTHRLEGSAYKGLRLAVYPHKRYSHLADHKTMNYLYQRMAGKWAQAQGADEALILNPDGTVSETNSANLLCLVDGRVYRPISEHVLPGTMEQAVCELLVKWGKPLEHARLTVEQLKKAELVILTNALMGAVPVVTIDGTTLCEDGGLCNQINEVLRG